MFNTTRQFVLFAALLFALITLGVFAGPTPVRARGNADPSQVPALNSQMNAKYVNGIQASKNPKAKRLLPLNADSKFPLSVIPQGAGSGLDADTLDSMDASAFQQRVDGTCTVGSAIRAISDTGDVTCGSAALGLPFTTTVNSSDPAFEVKNTGSDMAIHGESGANYGLQGTSNGAAGVQGTGYVGVQGTATNQAGAGISGTSLSNDGTAVRIGAGALQVSGAGVGTPTAAFIHTTTANNISNAYTEIDHVQTNNTPGAILIVTQNYSPPGGATATHNHPIGVSYVSNKWRIFNEDSANMVAGVSFNVLIIRP